MEGIQQSLEELKEIPLKDWHKLAQALDEESPDNWPYIIKHWVIKKLNQDK